MSSPESQPELEAPDPARFEPTPYFYGISDNPRTTWAEVRESRGPEFPDLGDLYRRQDEVIAAFSAAERAAEPGQVQPGEPGYTPSAYDACLTADPVAGAVPWPEWMRQAEAAEEARQETEAWAAHLETLAAEGLAFPGPEPEAEP